MQGSGVGKDSGENEALDKKQRARQRLLFRKMITLPSLNFPSFFPSSLSPSFLPSFLDRGQRAKSARAWLPGALMTVAMKLGVGRNGINPARTAQGLPDGGSGFGMGFEERLRVYLSARWWRTPMTPAVGRQKQWISEFQDS